MDTSLEEMMLLKGGGHGETQVRYEASFGAGAPRAASRDCATAPSSNQIEGARAVLPDGFL